MFYVRQHSPMDCVNDLVRPELPIFGRPQVVFIPGRAFQSCSPIWERREQKLTPARYQEAIQMWRMDFAIRCPFVHWRGVFGHRERQQARLVPDFDWLYKWAGGEYTMPDCSRSTTANLSLDRIGDTHLEDQLPRRWQPCE